MKSILVISNMYPSINHPYYGNFVKLITNELRRSFLIHLSVQNHTKGPFKKAWNYLVFYLKSIIKVNRLKPSVIFVHYPSYSWPIIMYACLFSKSRIVLNFHGGDLIVRSKFSRLQLRLLSLFVNAFDLVVVPSEHFATVVASRFPSLGKSKIFVSPSGGVDTEKFRPLEADKVFDFIFVSSVNRMKGFEIFMQALHKVRLKNKLQFNACIVGKGDEAYIEQQLDRTGMKDWVQYEGVVEHSQLPKYLNRSRYFIFPTLYDESLGLVCLEAQACGLPVIASDIEVTGEYVMHDKNGYLFKRGDVNDLAEHLGRALENDIYSVFSQSARTTSLKYDRLKVSEDLISKLDVLCQ